MRRRPPHDAVFPVREMPAQGTHDSSVAGDEHVLIGLLLQIPEKGSAPPHHRGHAFHALRRRKDLRKHPVERHRRTEKPVTLQLVRSEIRLDQTLVDDHLILAYAAENRRRTDRPSKRTRENGVKADVPDLLSHLLRLPEARIVQRLVRPPLHQMLRVQIRLSVPRQPDIHRFSSLSGDVFVQQNTESQWASGAIRAPSGARTPDTLIKSQVLYQLS